MFFEGGLRAEEESRREPPFLSEAEAKLFTWVVATKLSCRFTLKNMDIHINMVINMHDV